MSPLADAYATSSHGFADAYTIKDSSFTDAYADHMSPFTTYYNNPIFDQYQMNTEYSIDQAMLALTATTSEMPTDFSASSPNDADRQYLRFQYDPWNTTGNLLSDGQGSGEDGANMQGSSISTPQFPSSSLFCE
ncbi:hypothetical protein MD484_g8907, partial [Candolleomyces efflorescens]